MKKLYLLIVPTLVLMFSSCSMPAADHKTPPSAKAHLPSLINMDGVTLGIGTSKAEFEDFYGRTIDNDWMIIFRSGLISATLKEDKITYLGTTLSSGKWWSLDNGIGVGTPIEQVRELLGKEDSNWPEEDTESIGNHRRLIYEFEDGSILALNYFVNYGHNDIKINTVAWFNLYSPNRGWFGIIDDDHSGTGDALVRLIVPTAPDAIYSITHESAIKVFLIAEKLTIFVGNSIIEDSSFNAGMEYEIINAEGAGLHDAQIHENLGGGLIYGSLRIETEGAWRIVVKVPNINFPVISATD